MILDLQQTSLLTGGIMVFPTWSYVISETAVEAATSPPTGIFITGDGDGSSTVILGAPTTLSILDDTDPGND